MNVEEVEISRLSPDPANVRQHSDEQITKLVGSLRRWGQTLPLLIDKNDIVRIGNARLEAMQRLGWTHCKIVRLDLPPSEWAALAIADNKLHDDSAFDRQALTDVLAALRAEDDELLTAAGYTPEELAALVPEPEPTPNPATPPADFPAYDESISTEHECPKCHYRWSGSSAPQGEAA